MDFSFTEDHHAFREALRSLLQKACTAEHLRAAWSNHTGRVPELWERMAELGIVGLTAPEKHGGLGMSELDLVLLLEESGRAALPEPLVETTAVGIPLLADLRANGVTTSLLKRAQAGQAVITIGLESAPYVSHANVADVFIMQRADELHLLSAEDVEIALQPSVDGARRIFSTSWVPTKKTLLARGDTARNASATALDRGALATAAQLLGVAQQMLDSSVEYAQVREQFGKPIGTFQAVKHALANASIQLEFARPLVYRAAYSMAERDEQRSLHVSLAKAYASEAAYHVSRAALQVHGAIGYSFEADLHLWMKRAWALGAAWGDASWHRDRIGKHILGGN
jgi:alkylation response protein AidB-like acyl-CoA dehydrogenase